MTARNLEVSIRIEINETNALLSRNADEAEAISSRHFRLVLDGAKSLEIDSLVNGLLHTSYPAIRYALAIHFADKIKKSKIKMLAFPDSQVVNHCALYRVDGEVGRLV